MRTLISQLNYVMEKHIKFGDEPIEAIDQVVNDFMLMLIEDDGEQCRIYESGDGTLINCWVGPPSANGYGFDDQVEWFIDDLITQTLAADVAGVSVAAINNAIRDGRLRGYRQPGSIPHRPGSQLVSRNEVEKIW